jgi:hypothetical protein
MRDRGWSDGELGGDAAGPYHDPFDPDSEP